MHDAHNERPDHRLRSLFERIFRRRIDTENVRVQDLEEWDSLSHIKLVMELEREFNIDIDPDTIAVLYSDFNTIVEYLRERGGAA